MIMRTQRKASKGEHVNAIRTSVDRDREATSQLMSPGDATTFDIDRQAGANISNVGGDQTIYYGDRSRAIRAGKLVAAFGLCLSLIGFALLVTIGVTAAHRVMHDAHAGGIHAPYTQYVASYWPAAAALLVAGFVFRRFARIMIGR